MIRKLLTEQKERSKIALIDNDKEILYNDIINKSKAMQALLKEHKQEKVAILLPNGADYIAAFWGAIEIGITVFPINIMMTVHEIVPMLKQTNIKTIITSVITRRLFEMSGFDTSSLKIIYTEELDAMRDAQAEVCIVDADVSVNDPMVMLSTSGTTGKHKLVLLSEKNIATSVHGYLKKLITMDSSRYTLCAPFSSVYGIMILSACLMKSFPIVIFEQPFTLDAFYRTVEKHRVTHYEGSASAPLMMEQFANKPVVYDISTLTYLAFGGSKVSGSTIKNLQSIYSDKVFFQGYGMTEASPLITKHPQAKVEKVESVGTAIEGVEIAVEVDGIITRTPYESGEIVVKGDNVMLRYYENERETSKVIKGGYLYTGDIGYIDEEGYLYICGRKKNIIIVRGYNVYPEEVEESIQNSMLVKDCLVYGQIDSMGNEMVCVDIVPANEAVRVYAIKKYCSEHLSEYKQPKKITFCDNIHKNITGKTKR